MVDRQISYAELRQLLLDLGFLEDLVQEKFHRFQHRPSGTLFLFRPYKARDIVQPGDIIGVRRHLDGNYLMPAAEFDRVLSSKTPA